MPLESDPIDWLLDSDGDITITSDIQFSTGVQAIRQGIAIRMQNFEGEWFMDLDNGVPYWGRILGEKFNEADLLAIFRVPLLATPGVTGIVSLTATWDGTTRTATINWEVSTEFGDTVADSLPIAA